MPNVIDRYPNLKRIILDLIDTHAAPKTHAAQHANGGSDEISAAGLSGQLTDNQPSTWSLVSSKPSTFTPSAHATQHEDGGADEISAAGLSGQLADNQPSTWSLVSSKPSTFTPSAHKANHEDGGADEISAAGLSGQLTDNQPTTWSLVSSKPSTFTPSAHKANHQDGGSDEISVEGLSGRPVDSMKRGDLYPQSMFDSIDGMDTVLNNTGSVTLNEYGALLDTGGTRFSTAQLRSKNYPLGPLHSFDVEQWARFAIYIDWGTDDNIKAHVTVGGYLTAKHYGFYFNENYIYGDTGDGSNQTQTVIKTLGTPLTTMTFVLEAHFRPANQVDLYVDGTLEGTISTNLPAGDVIDRPYMFFRIRNTSIGEVKQLRVSHYALWQKSG